LKDKYKQKRNPIIVQSTKLDEEQEDAIELADRMFNNDLISIKRQEDKVSYEEYKSQLDSAKNARMQDLRLTKILNRIPRKSPADQIKIRKSNPSSP
jgi:hypothetical protein